MANEFLSNAKRNKNDEFYTQWVDIESEVQAYLEFDPNVFREKTILCPCDDPEWSNFTKFFALHFKEYGLKKLISTSYAPESKANKEDYQITLFELNDPKFDESKTNTHGKIFILDSKDINKDGIINIDDLQWDYMNGDGDFRSEEVMKLRDEADIIITNPPFSLFREFLTWILDAEKQFLIVSNMNAITYKEVFPLIKYDCMWMGLAFGRSFKGFIIPKSYPLSGSEARIDEHGNHIVSTNSTIWFTNLDHGRRHQPLPLMTMSDNLKFSKHEKIKDKVSYARYDNYDAIEVPYTDAIPSDYNGVMGVPISFLNKYCPEQFEIIGASDNGAVPDWFKLPHFKKHNEPYVNNKKLYKRIFIKHKGAVK